jgi:plastocyanin
MPARTRTFIALPLSALAFAFPACGGSGPTVRERTPNFTVTLDDYLMRPQTLRVPKGRQLTVTAVNRGRLGHTFRIRSINHTVLRLTTIEPGKQFSRSFKLAPGTYRMFCALANHEELGMHGTLVVG